jgi:hypothetical protein
MGQLNKRLIPLAVTHLALIFLIGCTPPQQTADDPVGVSPNASLASAQNLIGSTPAVLDAEFGQPALLRVDGTAQVWLYHASGCGLNLILYPDTSGVPRVAMVTAADGSDEPASCTASLLQAHVDAALEHPAAS